MSLRVDGMRRGLADLGEALGDETRRSILQFVIDADEPVTAVEISDAFGLHRTVARTHLEKLAETGFLKTGRRPAATGVGRPRKTYEVSGDRIVVMLPPRRYESLARLLLQLVEDCLPTTETIERAQAAGREYGLGVRRELRHGEEGRLSPAAVCSWLNQEGYAARYEPAPDGDAYVFENCVYREIADHHSEIASAFCRGMLCGLVGAGCGDLTQTHDLVEHGYCRHVVAQRR